MDYMVILLFWLVSKGVVDLSRLDFSLASTTLLLIEWLQILMSEIAKRIYVLARENI